MNLDTSHFNEAIQRELHAKQEKLATAIMFDTREDNEINVNGEEAGIENRANKKLVKQQRKTISSEILSPASSTSSMSPTSSVSASSSPPSSNLNRSNDGTHSNNSSSSSNSGHMSSGSVGGGGICSVLLEVIEKLRDAESNQLVAESTAAQPMNNSSVESTQLTNSASETAISGSSGVIIKLKSSNLKRGIKKDDPDNNTNASSSTAVSIKKRKKVDFSNEYTGCFLVIPKTWNCNRHSGIWNPESQ